MKTIYKNLLFGAVMMMFAALTATTTFAQDAADVCKEIEAKQALYKQFTDNFDKKDIERRKTAVTAGDQYVQKYGACADDKAIVDYLNANLPGMKTGIADEEKKAATQALYTRFNTAAESKNVAEIMASGKNILAKQPEFLDVIITLANAGFTQASANPPVETFNEDTINYAKTAIQKIEAGKESETKNYGAFSYAFKNPKFSDTKSYALGELNYAIGYVMYHRQGKNNADKKKEALPYFYKAVQYNSLSKNDPTVYQTIGAWYLDETIKIDKMRTEAIKAAGNKDTEETLAMLANQKGYADRAIDAYARAYKIASANTDPKNKDYKDSLYNRLKELYGFRYDGKTEGIDTFVATVMSKPLPDPSTPITPVKEEAPATTPATTGTTTTPATTTTTKPATTTTKPTSDTMTPPTTDTRTTATTTTKPKVKKTVTPKKKGTR